MIPTEHDMPKPSLGKTKALGEVFGAMPRPFPQEVLRSQKELKAIKQELIDSVGFADSRIVGICGSTYIRTSKVSAIREASPLRVSHSPLTPFPPVQLNCRFQDEPTPSPSQEGNDRARKNARAPSIHGTMPPFFSRRAW